MSTEKREILSELSLLRDKLRKNEQQFDFTDDDYLTEALIFERKALHLRLAALLARAKKHGVSAGYEERFPEAGCQNG